MRELSGCPGCDGHGYTLGEMRAVHGPNGEPVPEQDVYPCGLCNGEGLVRIYPASQEMVPRAEVERLRAQVPPAELLERVRELEAERSDLLDKLGELRRRFPRCRRCDGAGQIGGEGLCADCGGWGYMLVDVAELSAGMERMMEISDYALIAAAQEVLRDESGATEPTEEAVMALINQWRATAEKVEGEIEALAAQLGALCPGKSVQSHPEGAETTAAGVAFAINLVCSWITDAQVQHTKPDESGMCYPFIAGAWRGKRWAGPHADNVPEAWKAAAAELLRGLPSLADTLPPDMPTIGNASASEVMMDQVESLRSEIAALRGSVEHEFAQLYDTMIVQALAPRPRVSRFGAKWHAAHGEEAHNIICGVGETPAEAIKAYWRKLYK